MAGLHLEAQVRNRPLQLTALYAPIAGLIPLAEQVDHARKPAAQCVHQLLRNGWRPFTFVNLDRARDRHHGARIRGLLSWGLVWQCL